VDMDFFAPRRDDWINKTDDYFRAGAGSGAKKEK
jgi:hypothetical protein